MMKISLSDIYERLLLDIEKQVLFCFDTRPIDDLQNQRQVLYPSVHSKATRHVFLHTSIFGLIFVDPRHYTALYLLL